MEKIITMAVVLKDMKNLDKNKLPIKFDLEVRSFNRYNKTGGRHQIYKNACLLQAPKKRGLQRLADHTEFKDPRHFENRTRNIKLEDGAIKKINILFIHKYNGLAVIY
jgi:hypothetical protein